MPPVRQPRRSIWHGACMLRCSLPPSSPTVRRLGPGATRKSALGPHRAPKVGGLGKPNICDKKSLDAAILNAVACHLFAYHSADGASEGGMIDNVATAITSQTVEICGEKKKIIIEREFIDQLRAISTRQGRSIDILVEHIDGSRPVETDLCSAIRLYVVGDLKKRAARPSI